MKLSARIQDLFGFETTVTYVYIKPSPCCSVAILPRQLLHRHHSISFAPVLRSVDQYISLCHEVYIHNKCFDYSIFNFCSGRFYAICFSDAALWSMALNINSDDAILS